MPWKGLTSEETMKSGLVSIVALGVEIDDLDMGEGSSPVGVSVSVGVSSKGINLNDARGAGMEERGKS